MSARKIDCVPSAKTTRGPRLLVAAASARAAPGRSPSSPSDGYQQKASSSVIRTSAWPSPVRSTKRRFGSPQSRSGSDANGAERSQPPSRGALEEARATAPSKLDEVELAVAGEVEQLLAPPSAACDGWARQRLQRAEARGALAAVDPAGGRALVALVEPGAAPAR